MILDSAAVGLTFATLDGAYFASIKLSIAALDLVSLNCLIGIVEGHHIDRNRAKGIANWIRAT